MEGSLEGKLGDKLVPNASRLRCLSVTDLNGEIVKRSSELAGHFLSSPGVHVTTPRTLLCNFGVQVVLVSHDGGTPQRSFISSDIKSVLFGERRSPLPCAELMAVGRALPAWPRRLRR